MLNLNATKSNNYIAFLLGGRVAEELIFNEITNGASNDIERATKLAHSMVCHWGFSETLGPIKYQKSGMMAINSPHEAIDFSEATAQSIDREITALIKNNYQIAKKILTDKKDALIRIADALMIWETLDNQQILNLVDGKDIGQPIITPKVVVPESETTKQEDVQFVQELKEQVAEQK
jgi:cell division protease FtsH